MTPTTVSIISLAAGIGAGFVPPVDFRRDDPRGGYAHRTSQRQRRKLARRKGR